MQILPNASRLLALLALSAAPAAAQCDLTTLYATNNGGAVGGAVYFDLQITAPILVSGVDVNTTTAAGSPIGLTMYTTANTAFGNETNAGIWTSVATDNSSATSAGGNVPSTINFTSPVLMNPGNYGVALVASGPGGSFNHSYTNGNGANQTYSNAFYTLNAGTASNTPFTAVFTPRVWNGTIHCLPANGTYANFSATPASGATPLNVQFTDTTFSSNTVVSWAWDLDGDGVVDSTMQNPTFAYPSTRASALVTLDAFNQCMGQFTARQSLIIAPSSFLGETGGGNGTSSGTAAGNYFDVQITNPEGINVFGVGVTPYDRVGLVQVDVYVTADTHVGKEGVASEWMHVGTGQGWSVGAPFTAPAVVPVALGSEFYLPVGNYGMAVYLSVPGGGTIPIAYTNGPAGSPYVGADLVIHPNGVGCSSVSLLGGCSFSPRLWNGGFYYSTFSQTGEAAVGFFGNGCDGSLGRSGLSYSGAPVLGTTMTVTVDTLPVDTAVLMNGFNNQASAFGPLPFDVGPLGAPGCFLRVDPVLNGFLVGTGGSASWSLQIPNWTILMGLPLFQQAVVFDPGFNAIGGVGSDAYGMHFGM